MIVASSKYRALSSPLCDNPSHHANQVSQCAGSLAPVGPPPTHQRKVKRGVLTSLPAARSNIRLMVGVADGTLDILD